MQRSGAKSGSNPGSQPQPSAHRPRPVQHRKPYRRDLGPQISPVRRPPSPIVCSLSVRVKNMRGIRDGVQVPMPASQFGVSLGLRVAPNALHTGSVVLIAMILVHRRHHLRRIHHMAPHLPRLPHQPVVPPDSPHHQRRQLRVKAAPKRKIVHAIVAPLPPTLARESRQLLVRIRRIEIPRFRNIRVPSPSHHQESSMHRSHFLKSFAKVRRQHDVAIAVTQNLVPRNLLRPQKHPIQPLAPEFIAFHPRLLPHNHFPWKFPRSFLITKQNHFHVRMQPFPTLNRIPLNDRAMSAKRLTRRKNRQHIRTWLSFRSPSPLLAQSPAVPSILNHRRPIRPSHPVQRPQHSALPQSAHVRDRFHHLAHPLHQPHRSTLHPQRFPRRNLIARFVVSALVAPAQRVFVKPVAPNQRIHRIQPRVPEEPHPQLKISFRAKPFMHIPARPFPQPAPPERRFLLDVPVRTRQKSVPRPSWQIFHLHRHSLFVELRRSPRRPVHFAKCPEHAPHHEQSIHVQQVAGVQPSHYFASAPRESRIQRRVQTAIRLRNRARQPRFVPANDLCRPIRRSIIHDDVFQVGVTLLQHRAHRRFQIFLPVVNRGHHRDPRPLRRSSPAALFRAHTFFRQCQQHSHSRPRNPFWSAAASRRFSV